MAAGLIIIPNWMPALDQNGEPLSGATLTFYLNNTTTPLPVYADAALTTKISPEAGSDGKFPQIFGEAPNGYSVVVKSAAGVVLDSLTDIYAIGGGGGALTPFMLGAAGDGTTDDAAAITAVNTYVAAAISQFAAVEDTFNLIQSGLTVDLTGIFAFSNTLITYPGVRYLLPTGSRLVALTDGQIMTRSPTLAELAATGAGAIYGSKATTLVGGGIIDGANKANIGRRLDTTAEFGSDEYIVTRCTYRKWATTLTGTAGSATVHLASVANVAPMDIIDIPADGNRFYSVISVNTGAKTAVLSRNMATSVVATPATNRAAGLSGNMAQQSYIEVDAHANDVGAAWGFNADGIGCTDMVVGGASMFHANMIGELCISGGPSHYGTTIQHNFELEIASVGGATWYDLYIEQISDAQADTLIPPVGFAPVTATTLHNLPFVFTAPDAGGNVFINIQWQANPGLSGFRRLIGNASPLLIDGLRTPGYALTVNPAAAGDYGIVEQHSAHGFCTIHNIAGPTNLGTIGQALVVTEAGAIPVGYRASWDWESASTFSEVFSFRQLFNQGAAPTWLLSYMGEANARLLIAPNQLQFGHDGSAAADTTLARNASASVPGLTVNGSPLGRKVAAPGGGGAAGLPGDWAAGGGRAYFYTGDGTTHSWTYVATTVL